MVIFFVGPDGTGKTEISTALSSFLGIPRFKVNTEKFNWENNNFKNSLYFDMLLPQFVDSLRYTVFRNRPLDFIVDRGFPCEWVYSQVFNRESDLEKIMSIDEEWSKLEGVIVFCLRNSYLDVRDDDLVPRDKLISIHEKYLEFSQLTKCRKINLFVDDFKNSDGLTFNLNAQVDFVYKKLLKVFR